MTVTWWLVSLVLRQLVLEHFTANSRLREWARNPQPLEWLLDEIEAREAGEGNRGE